MTVLVTISSPADSILTNGLNREGGKGWELESMKIHWIQGHKKDQLKAGDKQQASATTLVAGCGTFCYIKKYKVRTISLSSNAYPYTNTHPATSAVWDSHSVATLMGLLAWTNVTWLQFWSRHHMWVGFAGISTPLLPGCSCFPLSPEANILITFH